MDGKQIRTKLIGSEDERAVSPVIGVILMVAITVILAAVIAAFVLDLGDSVEEDPRAAVDIDDSNQSEVDVSVVSLDNADGVAIVNGTDTSVDDNGVLDSTGASVSVGDVDAGDDIEVSEETDFTVQAFFGDVDDVEGGTIDDAESSAVINDFTADDGS